MTRQPFPKLLRPFVALLLGIAIIPAVAAPSFAQEAKNVEKPFRPTHIKHKIRARTPSERDYFVHLPSNYNPAEKLPLVVVLHGCLEFGGGSSPFVFLESIERDTHFDDIADQERFIVVYPNHKFNPSSGAVPFCWEWWEEANGNHRGKGDVADVAEIVKAVASKYSVDLTHIHITGLSSGAAMTVAAMVAYPDIFASGSPTAGMPYSETKADFNPWSPKFKSVEQIVAAMESEMDGRKRIVPIFIIQSKDDETVNVQYAKNIRDSWGKLFGFDTRNPTSSESGTTKGTDWTREKYADPDGNTVVETLFLTGLKHGWYGDGDAQFAFSNAPDTAQLVWEFFKSHPGPPAQLGTTH